MVIILAIVAMSVFTNDLALATSIPPVNRWMGNPPPIKIWEREKSSQHSPEEEGMTVVSDRPARLLSRRKALIVETDILPFINIQRYHDFWEKQGWSTVICRYDYGDWEALRNFEIGLRIDDNRLINVHLVGNNMPYCYFEHLTYWDEPEPERSVFVSDLPFENLTGIWTDEGHRGMEAGNGLLDRWVDSEGYKIQLFVTRLVTNAPLAGSPQWVVENFYQKLYTLYENGPLPGSDVLVVSDIKEFPPSEDAKWLRNIYGGRNMVQYENDLTNPNNVTRGRVLNWLERQSRIFSLLNAHGNSDFMVFENNGDWQHLSAKDFVNRDSKSWICYLYSCGTCYFPEPRSIGNTLTGLENGGVAVIGFTSITHGLWFGEKVFYEALQKGESIGESYMRFFNAFQTKTPGDLEWKLREYGQTVLLGEASIGARLRFPRPDLSVKWKKPIINADKSLSVKLVISNEGYVPSPACMVRLYIKKGGNEPVLMLERSMKILPKRKRIVDLEIPAVDLPNLPFQLIAEANPLSEGQRLFEEESYANNTAVVKVE